MSNPEPSGAAPTGMRRWSRATVFPTAVLAMNLSPMALRLYLALCNFTDRFKQCFPSNRKILKLLPEGTTERSLQRAKQELTDFDLLRCTQRYRPNGSKRSLLYELYEPCGKATILSGEGEATS
jgi:hypothetical protein